MSYIGNTNTIQQYAPTISYLSGNGSTTAFTLPIAVASAAQIIVIVGNVIQNPSSAFSVSGTTLTFTSAPPSGTNNIWVEYTALQTNTIAPSQGTVRDSSFGSVTKIPFVAGSSIGAGDASIMKNRIINGAMVQDQRNNGASITPANSQYLVDRFQFACSQASKFTAQQNAGSVTPPAGFSNYLGLTTASTVSIGATDYFYIQQKIEGFNTSDLAWGTASAKTVTLSFWIYSSLTGTFGGAINNSAQNYNYPFSYTISSANTWTQISVTITPPTTGTWVTNNGIGMNVIFGLGVGATYSGTAGSWSSNLYVSATGATSVVGTNGATFYITGVQLEVGSSATGFEYRQYGQELALCQRYLPAYRSATNSNESICNGYFVSANALYSIFPFQVQSRVPATGITVVAGTGTFSSSYTYNGPGANPSAATFVSSSTMTGNFYWTVTGATAYQPTQIISLSSGNVILFTGCEL
jgi:hypothetical protein